MPFQLRPYFPPVFSTPALENAPDAVFRPAPRDGVAPENFHAMSIFPEYFKIAGQWHLARESRMDCVAVWDRGRIDVREFRRLRQGDLVAVGSLDALAEVALEDYEAGILSVPDWEHACLCPMVDARRMEVYAQVFDTTGKPLNEVSAEVVDGESFAHFRSQGRPFVIFGSGARKCAGILPDAVLVEVAPSARGLARLAQRALDAGCTEDIAYFEPFYLKDFVVTTSKKKLF